VIATNSELMITVVDAHTCIVIVLDSNINSKTKFKQIIGRGARINEEYGKLSLTNNNNLSIFTVWCISVAVFGALQFTIFGAYSVTDYSMIEKR
jgi:type I site-specific restriction endonuclease